MKRLLLFLLLAPAAFGQLSSTGSITTNASNCFTTNVCIVLNLFNSPAVSTTTTAIAVSGTWTGTLSFEVSTDLVNFTAIPAAPSAGGATVTSTTANGTWIANVQSLNQIRVRGSAAMTGSAVVLLQASVGTSGIPFPNYAVASLPTNLPIGTLAVATDSNAGSCTVGGSTALALCRWSGSAWVAMSSGGGGSGTVTNTGGALTLNAVMLGAGGSDSKVDTALSTDAAGSITDTQGTIVTSKPFASHTVTWNAAGVAFTDWLSTITCTAAAANSIAASFGAGGNTWVFKYGTATCASPTFQVSDGTATNPAVAFTASSNTGMSRATVSQAGILFDVSGTVSGGVGAAGMTVGSGGSFVWSNNATPLSATQITTLSSPAAGVVAVGTTAANTNGVIAAAAVRGGGAAAALTGTGACATFGAQTGGSNIGQSSCASATAASTLTITPGTTAPNGWICYVQDETTRANLFQQTSHTATACTLTATSVTQNDVFVFSAFQY